MNIDWYKYVLQLLPTGLRTRLLFEFVRTLIWQVPGLQARILVWFDDARFRASMNASVMGLQKLIERYLGIQAVITELDGKPTDFKVSIQGTVDEARMKSIVDQYKLAGKSYVFQSSAIAFTCEFADWVCEVDRDCIIQVHLDSAVGTVITVSVTSSVPVATDVQVIFNVNSYNHIDGVDYPLWYINFAVTLNAGENYKQAIGDAVIEPGPYTIYVVDNDSIVLDKTSDDYLDYIISY